MVDLKGKQTNKKQRCCQGLEQRKMGIIQSKW